MLDTNLLYLPAIMTYVDQYFEAEDKDAVKTKWGIGDRQNI
jgi:hypothetical protein